MSESRTECSRRFAAEPELLTVPEAAVLLTCSTRHLWRLIDAGKGPPVLRLGKFVRIPRQRLNAWIEEQTR